MKLLVDRLKTTPEAQRFEASEAWTAAARERVPELGGELSEPVAVDLEVHRMGQDVYLEGTLTGALDLGCGRCLARYRQPLREPFRLVLEPAGSRVPPEPEAARDLAQLGMCLGDELEMGWFQGHEIDLGAFFTEVVALALPFQPLCREDCRGLCPRCGADRNVETCACGEVRASSPFAALRGVRGGARRGES